ncbi:MAG: hypothetical protein ACOH2J_06740 [Allorhizobium sp.]
MAEITNELMYELLKTAHTEAGRVKDGQRHVRAELNALRGTVVSIQLDLHNIYGILDRPELRLERIENCLELREISKAQSRFEPHP